jgi:hypothetical protein
MTFVIILSCVFENNQFRFACKVYQIIMGRGDFDLYYKNDGFDSFLPEPKMHVVWDPTTKLLFFFFLFLPMVKLFGAMAKHIPPPTSHPSHPPALSSFLYHNNRPPPSPMQWGNPEGVKKRLGSDVINIHFECGVIKKPVLSPKHYWETSITKGGALM